MPNRFFSPGSRGQNAGLFLVRVLTGLFLVYHGREIFDPATMKGYTEWDQFKNPSGSLLIYVGKVAELAGGFLLTLGLFTRLAAVLVAGTMLYISLFVGHGKVWYEDQHPFLFVLLALVFLFTGPGTWSLDHKLFGKN